MLPDNHKLTDNDLDIIKHLEKERGVKCSSLGLKTLHILSILYRGLHHLPYGKLDDITIDETFYIEYQLKGNIATTDFNTLTRLVFAAHDLAVRVEIQNTKKHCQLILFHERKHNGDAKFENTEHHPTLKQAVDWWNQ